MGTLLPFIGAVKRTSDNTALRIICGPRRDKEEDEVLQEELKTLSG
jgi:hypothetical protein